MDKVRKKIGTWLIRLGHKLYYVKELYTEYDGVWEWNVLCARCRYCGSSTQTTDRMCWKCR